MLGSSILQYKNYVEKCVIGAVFPALPVVETMFGSSSFWCSRSGRKDKSMESFAIFSPQVCSLCVCYP